MTAIIICGTVILAIIFLLLSLMVHFVSAIVFGVARTLWNSGGIVLATLVIMFGLFLLYSTIDDWQAGQVFDDLEAVITIIILVVLVAVVLGFFIFGIFGSVALFVIGALVYIPLFILEGICLHSQWLDNCFCYFLAVLEKQGNMIKD